MILYHFTSIERWGLIERSGMIRTTESNVSPTREHAGPDVVWLTDEDEPDADALAIRTVDGTDKTAVRITVDLDDSAVVWWPDFASAHEFNRRWRRALERGHDPESWWVTMRPIPLAEVVAIEMAETGDEPAVSEPCHDESAGN